MWKFIFGWLTMLSLLLLTMECDRVKHRSEGILVSTGWLQEHLEETDLVVLHAGTREGYDSLHIPGARLIFPGDFTRYRDDVRNELPALDTVVHLLRKAGVNEGSRIVLCYENEDLIARTARVYLTLVYAGLSENTFLLNGGLPLWLEEERETTDVPAEQKRGNIQAGIPEEVVISASELEKSRWSPQWVIIDARSDGEYRGTAASEDEEAEGGHVEGAYFLPYRSSFREDKSYVFKPDLELDKLLRGSGIKREATTVVYCGSGIRASVSFLVAKHLGYPVLLYDGSFEEWEELNLPLTPQLAPPEMNP